MKVPLHFLKPCLRHAFHTEQAYFGGPGRRSRLHRGEAGDLKYEKWETVPPHPEAKRKLEEAGITPLMAAVLSARGIETPEDARRMLTPEEEPLLDPMGMKDMDRAAARIRQALDRKELTAVYGDYDVDGITATALMASFLQQMGGRVIYYIPGRLVEGYGLNEEAIAALGRQGVTLLITVDCGITALEETRFARENGIDVIVTDHHECRAELPEAVAVVNPLRPDCPYPFKGLAGVGVALKLAMAAAGPEKAQEVFASCRDLAALGTAADVMPMTGENRRIVCEGLKDLNPPRRLGLAWLTEMAGFSGKTMTSVSLGYTLAPRLNAAGRMGQASMAVELLLTRDPQRAAELAGQLCQLNAERQAAESDIYSQCIRILEEEPQEDVIVLAGTGWHQGVAGIVASRLAERYSCPAVMICMENGVGKGSCRSWGGINLFEQLQSCGDLLESYGGHAQAAGFTVREENLPALADALRERIRAADREPDSVLTADAEVQPGDLTVEAVTMMNRLEPWGAGNPRPVLTMSGVQFLYLTRVGQGRHLKLRLEAKGVPLEAIWFSAGDAELGLEPGSRLDIAFTPQINDFRGVRTVQLQIMDLRPLPTRAEMEQGIYRRFKAGYELTPREAEVLLPTRSDFADLWRWLNRQASSRSPVEGDLHCIARGISRSRRKREAPVRTMMCLEVLEERGLIRMNRRTDRLQITLCSREHKVDLEASEIMIRLRRALEG